MKIRYKQTYEGPVAVAKVYSKEEHNINFELLDSNAVSIIDKLQNSGFEAYLVGGAIRDLLLDRIPKDFDVVTSASPRQVHKIFRNSRIIGRRFKLVHVTFGNKIIEVSTFRSTDEHEEKSDNVFGSIEQDSKRRDFSINSLYYDPSNQTLIDFNNSLHDFEMKRITSLIPLNKTFKEDPVRMIRALKYSVTTGFKLRFPIKLAIRQYSDQLLRVSTSRLTEELNKILYSGYSSQIIREFSRNKILVYILPCISVFSEKLSFYDSLSKLDEKVLKSKSDPDVKKVFGYDCYLALTAPFIIVSDENKFSSSELYKDIIRQMKVLLTPNTPPNFEIEDAAKKFMKLNGLSVPKSKKTNKIQNIVSNKEKNRVGYASRKSTIDFHTSTVQL